jgi:uncharacterized protein YodC (DUF2158 family)
VSAQKFKAGDIVRLRSGGPQMTVVEYSPDNTYRCKWFDAKYNLSESSFVEDELEPAPKRGPMFEVI